VTLNQQSEGVAVTGQYLRHGRCVLGVHLHE
jgi:hypothetical protein